jgi:SpoVK/Ycf46/Vps4 family AAA+-type ATPase
VLEKIKQTSEPTLFVLCDYHPYLPQQPEHTRLLKEIAMGHAQLGHIVVLVSHALELPPELQAYSARIALALPEDVEIMAIVREEVAKWSRQNGNASIKTQPGVLKKLVKNLRGMTREDVRRLARTAIYDDGAITETDLPALNKAKFELIDMDGLLHFEYDTERFSAVGGLSALKQWLQQREQAFVHSDQQADSPKGLMLLGVQGGGKSLAARAIAGLWGVPLLRLDMAALFNKYIGETEKNLQASLRQAELMSPCVLWIDEVEKGVASGDSDDGTARRVLGTLLTWMAERKQRVFMVMTANDVSKLPPELLRKGRLDEIFFVDLPTESVRKTIFAIHLQKRGFDPEQFDLAQLAEFADGFSGAEIEQAVVAARHSSAAARQPLTSAEIVKQLQQTYPLSVVMAEQLAALRHWAADRTVSAQ